MPAKKKPRKQLAVNVSGNCVFTQKGDGWEIYFPFLDISAVGPTRPEARKALEPELARVVNATDESKARWQEFCQNNIIEIEMTPEEERAEKEARKTAAALAKGKGPHFAALTPDNFDDTVANGTPTLVDFWAAWCQPCLHMVPVLERFQSEVGDQLRIASVDVEAHEALWERFDLKGIPTMILFRSGAELGRIIGTRTVEDLEKEVDALIG